MWPAGFSGFGTFSLAAIVLQKGIFWREIPFSGLFIFDHQTTANLSLIVPHQENTKHVVKISLPGNSPILKLHLNLARNKLLLCLFTLPTLKGVASVET